MQWSKVTAGSIRWRILKDYFTVLGLPPCRGYSGFDPMEDTERFDWSDIGVTWERLQRVRSDGGY